MLLCLLYMDKMRTKVLLLITKSTLGGAQRYVEDVAMGLDPQVFDVSVAAGGEGPLIDSLKKHGIHVHHLTHLRRDVSLLQEIRSFFELIHLIRTVRPDVLHINSSKAGVLGGIVGRMCGVPRIIFTAHGWAFNEDRSYVQKRIIRALHALTIYLSHVTITVSDGMRAQMTAPFTKSKMQTIHLGRTVNNVLPKEDARGILEMHVQNADTRLIDFHQDFWFGSVAELHPVKQLHRVIDAVAALTRTHKNIRLVLVHDGELRTALEQQVRQLRITEHVFFTGSIPDAARLLPAFDAFVLPSRSEAFAYVLLEAGHASLPVVATNVGGIPDIITTEVNGLLVPPEDTQALTEAMERVYMDQALRERLAKVHHEKVQSFTVKKMIEKTATLYTS
jgi:glycosyltransferase involved in cell wall biosynthesis